MRRYGAALAAVAGTGVLVVLSGCGAPREERYPGGSEMETASAAPRPASIPDALMVRFRQVEGTGFERESWEIEVLQMGGDVRIRGSVRTGGSSVPIYRPMDAAEFRELWQWLRGFPLDRYQVRVDETAPEAPWTKSLEVDVVLGPDERWLSRNTWTRPLLPDDWVRQVEVRMHALVLDLAEAEVDRLGAASPPAPAPAPALGAAPGGLPDEPPLPAAEEAQEILRRAREAIGAEPPAPAPPPAGGPPADPGDSGE